MGTPQTRIELCGRLLVEMDGERLEGALPGRQGRLLFAYLVMHRGRPVRRDELVEALWAEDGQPASGDALLRPPLSRLRKALGPGRLEGRGELTLLLPDDAYVDWEAAQAALARTREALGRSDFAAAWQDAGEAAEIAERGLLPGLEADWIEERRRELADLRVEALEAAAVAGAALGGAALAGAERAARAAVEAAPFRESAHAALMEVLRAGGNVAEALRAYEDLRTMLRDELGATPSARVMALHERLLRDDEPAVAPAGPPSAPATPAAAAGTARSRIVVPAPSGPEIVERHNEVLLISDLLDDAAAGQGRVALIEGPAGIGKSRLLVEARREAAERGVQALFARGSELEREFPFGVVRQLFEAAIADPAERERLFAGAAAPARAVFESPGGGADDPADASFAALHALFWLAVNLTDDGPLLLAIDDLHWVDRPSLRFVAYLTRRLEGLPIAIATTVRTGEPPADAALLAEVTQDNVTAPVRPRPLSEEAVAAIVRERLGEQGEGAFIKACHRATVGNPLLLRQLLSALEADGVAPDAAHAHVVREIGQGAVSRSVLLRLSRLGDEATAVARAVAVLGEHADLPAIGALARIDEERVAAASAALARAEILRPERPLGFVHPLVRDAVYHDLPLGERELQHSRAAQMLADAGAAPEQVAAHLLAVPRWGEEWVTSLLLKAARGAMRKAAPESAVAYLRRALDEPPPPELLPQMQFELGIAEMLTRGPAAVEHLEAAYNAIADPVARAPAAAVLARALLFTGDPAEGLEVSRTAARALPDEASDLRAQMDAFERVTVWFGASPPSTLEELLPFQRVVPLDAGTGEKMNAGLAALALIYRGGPAGEAAEIALSALAGGEVVATDNGLLAFGPVSVLVLADRPEAIQASNAQMADAYERGSLFSMSGIHLWRGFLHLRRGELLEAEEMLRASFESHDRWGYGPVAHQYTGGFFCSTMVARGDLVAARAGLERGSDWGAVSDGSRWWLEAKVELLHAEERYEEAIECSRELEQRFPHWNFPPASRWRGFRALSLGALGRADEARVVAEEDLALARASGAPGGLGRALRVLGTVVEGADGFAHLWEALDVLDGTTARLEHAQALAALGAALRREGVQAEARQHLTQALELAEVISAGSVAAFARAELVASGVRPSIERPSGVRALTDTQRRLAALAAEGLGEHEIAQAMFVTPRAIDYQLGDVYRKLGVRSRDELALALASE